jgi:hypothetical protein
VSRRAPSRCGSPVEDRADRRTATARGTTQNSEQVRYRISDAGVDKLENASLCAVIDIDGLRGQLQKPEPDHHLIQRLWGNAERVAAVGGGIELADRVREALGPLLG